jgi:hypothetical protein
MANENTTLSMTGKQATAEKERSNEAADLVLSES